MNTTNEGSTKSKQQKQTVGSRDGNPGSQQNRRGGKATQNVNKQQETVQNGPPSPAPPPLEEHIPMHGFNASEVRELLKKGVDVKAHVYKSEKPQSEKSASPWGQKAGAMANGDDFWLRFRKQVTNLQQSGGTAQGG